MVARWWVRDHITTGDMLARSTALVKAGGALVSVMDPPPATRSDIRTVFFIRQPSRAQLVALARLVAAGRLRPPPIGAAYPLAEAKNAFTAQANHAVAGKVILQP